MPESWILSLIFAWVALALLIPDFSIAFTFRFCFHSLRISLPLSVVFYSRHSVTFKKIEFYNAENWPVFLVHLVNFVVGFFVLHPMLTFDLAEENKVMHFTITFGLHVTSPFYISTLLCSARKKYELCISWEKTTSRMKNQYVLIRAA